MASLSVNINKIATLRNARGGNIPDVIQAALKIQKYGAHGITVHPRPDERHIRYSDVTELRKNVNTEFNIEGYPSKEWMDLVLKVKPDQATLVPDPPEALTSNAGWDVIKNSSFLKEIIAELKKNKIRTSIFIETDPAQIKNAKNTGTDRVELYTESYAKNYSSGPERAIEPFVKAAQLAQSEGLGINAGHDLSLENLEFFIQKIPGLIEVSIGHALIADALYMGLENTIKAYLEKAKSGKS